MKLGMHLHELWRNRLGVVLSLLIATVVSVSSAYKISLVPPSLQPRAMGMSAASTHVLVDNANSVLLNLGLGADQLNQMTQRTLLVGNVMASIPVRQYIARRAGVPVQLIQMTSPLTPQYPRPIADDPQNQRKITDLARSNDQYRINIKANPTVPILDVYTEASSVRTAEALANGAVDGLRDYLTALARGQRVSPIDQPRLEQLGRAEGGAVTGGVNFEVAVLLFFFVFALSSAATLVIARVIGGWRLSAEARKLGAAGADTNGRARVSDHEMHRALAR